MQNITSHATGVVIPTIESDGTVKFVVSEYYRRRNRRSRRQTIETSENGEKVSETLQRVLDDEISAHPGSAKLEILDTKPFFVKFTNDERHPGGIHAKFFFFALVTGELRKETKNDGEEELGPMLDIEAEELIEKMTSERTVPLHLEVTQVALAALSNKSLEVYYRYSKILPSLPQPEEPTEEEWEAIRAYEKWDM